MRAIEFVEPGQAELVEIDPPTCGPRDVLIHAECSGVSNGTERSFLVGGPYGGSRWPCRCGYQTVGRIVERGRDVEGYAVGDRVFAGGFGHHAELIGATVAGGEQDDANLTIKLSDGLDSTHAALLGVASVAMHDVRRTRASVGDRVLILGAGLIGQFAAQAAIAMGAQTWLANRSAERLEVARACGVKQTVHLGNDDAWDRLADIGFDVAIEACGGDVLDRLVGDRGRWPGVLRPNARLFLSAGRADVRYHGLAAQLRRLEILHATHFHRDDLRHCLRLTTQGSLKPQPLLRDIVSIEDAPRLYRRLRDEPAALLGTVFIWSP